MKKQLLLGLIAFTILAGCTPAAVPDAGLDFDGLVAALQAHGAEAAPAGSFTSLPLTGEGRLIHVNGHDVQVYEYADAAAARQEAGYISPDGGQITMPDPANPDVRELSIVEWIATPHFYQSGRLVVQYIGDDPQLIALLESLLGPQFAGGASQPRLPLMVSEIELAPGAPMSFEEAARQAASVALVEVTAVEQGFDYIASADPRICRPVQWVTVTVLKVYKGPLAADQTHLLFQEAGVTDLDSGCGDNPAAEKVLMIMAHDPLYEANQRYLLAFRPLAGGFDPDPALRAANGALLQLIEARQPGQVLFNGRLLVEQGGHARLEQADVLFIAYDDYGRAIPGQPTAHSLADFEALIAP